jgi:hypothetical protein
MPLRRHPVFAYGLFVVDALATALTFRVIARPQPAAIFVSLP